MILLRITLAGCMALAMLAGCSDESPLPLTSEAINRALRTDITDLRAQAAGVRHPALPPGEREIKAGLGPDEAAAIAILANPSLRAIRAQRGIADAQLLQAGLLPNPSLEWTNEFPYAGPDHFIAYGIGIKWDVSALISHSAKVQAAQDRASSVVLDIAWQEWQVAQSARSAVYRRLSLETQLALARDVDERLAANAATIRQAVEQQQKTGIELSAAQAASQEAHTAVLELQRELAKQKQALNRLLGLPADAEVALRQDVTLPAHLHVPAAAQLQEGVEDRRLDLLALRRGYESQQATLRAAVLSRFPKLELGAGNARDTTKTYTFGYSLAMDLPIFDQNQGNIAIERATRQKLFDEFTTRVFEARSDIDTAEEEIRSLNNQIAYAEESLPALERLVSDYEHALASGNADILSYYTIRNDLAKKRVEVLKLKQELLEVWISLENAAGRLFLDAAQSTTLPTGGAAPPSEPATNPGKH